MKPRKKVSDSTKCGVKAILAFTAALAGVGWMVVAVVTNPSDPPGWMVISAVVSLVVGILSFFAGCAAAEDWGDTRRHERMHREGVFE